MVLNFWRRVYLSRDMRYPKMLFVRPAKPRITRLNILWLLSYWLQRLVWVYTCQNAALLEITFCGSFFFVFVQLIITRKCILRSLIYGILERVWVFNWSIYADKISFYINLNTWGREANISQNISHSYKSFASWSLKLRIWHTCFTCF